jgi:hypothetical protein
MLNQTSQSVIVKSQTLNPVQAEMKDVIANKLSTLFGGKAPIKAGVGPKPDIRKEKADCLAQINDEIKKFDSEEI